MGGSIHSKCIDTYTIYCVLTNPLIQCIDLVIEIPVAVKGFFSLTDYFENLSENIGTKELKMGFKGVTERSGFTCVKRTAALKTV